MKRLWTAVLTVMIGASLTFGAIAQEDKEEKKPEGRKEGDKRAEKKGPRDGDAPKKEGPRDGEAPKKRDSVKTRHAGRLCVMIGSWRVAV